MYSMEEDALVVGGVDAHADTHHAAALDERGALLATNSFPTTTPGYRELAGLAERLRRDRRDRSRVDRLVCSFVGALSTRARHRTRRGQPATRPHSPACRQE